MANKISDYKYILGMQCFANADSGACIIRTKYDSKDYDYVAISEERLLRKKYPYTFPIHSINYCMERFNIKSLDNIDLLVSDIIREPVWNRSGPSYNVTEFDYIKSKLKISEKKIIQINHHLAHAASAYYTSGFDDSAILIVDGNGTDLESNSFFIGKNKKIKLIDKYKARGIGTLYNVITEECLNLGKGGEGKTMGLAPYGNKGKPVLDFSKVKYDGVITDYSSLLKRLPYSDIISLEKKFSINKFAAELPKRKKSENIMKGKWSRIAFDLQNETERCIIHLGKELEKKTKSKNICIAGGVALNSVSNQKLFDATNFKDIFVYPACTDAGVPFGLAVWALYNFPKIVKKPPKIYQLQNAFTGITYSSSKIQTILKKYNIKSKIINLSEIAKKLSDGKIIGWFQGGSEYGPRALGNRSILADSRNIKMKNFINYKVKHRENYRPFAPAVLEEDSKTYFKLRSKSPFMLLVADVKKQKKIPAVTHIDGTARAQTISKKQNSIFYNLILEFKKITGIGCILNTSFNDAGEPIVETPEDALITFLGSRIDYLVLGDRVIDAKSVNKSLRKNIFLQRTKKIASQQKKILKSLTVNYSTSDRKKYFKDQKKKAYWYALEKSIEDLNRKIDEWVKKKRKIILYGTFDHTQLLLKKIDKLNRLEIIGFKAYEHINDDINNMKKVEFQFNELKKIPNNFNDEFDILISSYEFAYDVARKISTNFPSTSYYKIYKGYSRSIEFNSSLKKIIKN